MTREVIITSSFASRWNIRAITAFLLLTTVCLTLHIQSAKFAPSFVAGHILHGDLRPESDSPGEIAHHVIVYTAPAWLTLLAILLCTRTLISREAIASSDCSNVKLLKYLARSFRAPPGFAHSFN
jgi:hypothetical protein